MSMTILSIMTNYSIKIIYFVSANIFREFPINHLRINYVQQTNLLLYGFVYNDNFPEETGRNKN